MVYYIRGDKEFQGEPERVYGANWAKTGSKWASNPHIREGRGQIDQKSANTVGYDPEDGVQRAPNLRILLLLPRIDFPVCLYFFCNMPSDCDAYYEVNGKSRKYLQNKAPTKRMVKDVFMLSS